jgi:hypothetical protein
MPHLRRNFLSDVCLMIVLGVCDYRPNRGVSRITLILSQCLEVSRVFRTFVWAERLPALAQAVMAPLICWFMALGMIAILVRYQQR